MHNTELYAKQQKVRDQLHSQYEAVQAVVDNFNAEVLHMIADLEQHLRDLDERIAAYNAVREEVLDYVSEQLEEEEELSDEDADMFQEYMDFFSEEVSSCDRNVNVEELELHDFVDSEIEDVVFQDPPEDPLWTLAKKG